MLSELLQQIFFILEINGTTLLDDPWNTIFSPFTNLLGSMFYLIPVGAIGMGLFVKTRNPVMVSMYLLSSGALLSSGSIFVGAMDMVPVYIMITAAGVAGLFISLILRR